MFQKIASYTTAIEAYIIKTRLEAEDIPAYIIFEHHIWADWTLSVALGGVRVLVPSVYYKEAELVIEKINSGVYESELDKTFPLSKPIMCPKCNAKDAGYENWRWKIVLLCLFILPFPLPNTRYRLRCEQCSYTWLDTQSRGYPLYISFYAIFVLYLIFFLGIEAGFQWCKLHHLDLYGH